MTDFEYLADSVSAMPFSVLTNCEGRSSGKKSPASQLIGAGDVDLAA
jgi:hypothetical protein